VWHYGRGLALVATGRTDAADTESTRLRELMSDESMKQPLFSPNTAAAALAPAPEMLAGEIAAARGDFDRAIAHLERSVRLENGLVYTEPSEFHFPPRHALGAVLLEAGRPSEAETVYWEDLRRNQDNGWALFGLLQALGAQGKAENAALVEARLAKAWARADVKLTASRFGRPLLQGPRAQAPGLRPESPGTP
jgi:tetratricopeptide (TPR) repeat protein